LRQRQKTNEHYELATKLTGNCKINLILTLKNMHPELKMLLVDANIVSVGLHVLQL
jgi:hypothetical protein